MQSGPPVHSQPWPRAQSGQSYQRHKRSHFPVTHRSLHIAPWSSLDDAWSRRILTPPYDTITLRDGHMPIYSGAGPLPHLGLVADLGFQAIDAGPLAIARLLEPMAMLWIHMAL